MIRILDRYLLRSFLANYVLSLFVLISLYVVLDLSFNADEFTETMTDGPRQQSSFLGGALKVVGNIIDYYVFNIPLYFVQLSGAITLFAACVTLARLQRQNEVTAVLSSGTSMYRLAMPILFAGLAMNAVLILDQELLIPAIAPKLARPRDNVEGARIHKDLWYIKDADGRLFSAQEFSPKDQEITGLIVLERLPEPGDTANNGQLRSVIRADRARWNERKGGWDLTQRGFRLDIGRQADFAVSDIGEKLTPVATDFYKTDLSPANLLLRKSAQWLDFLSLGQIKLLQNRGDADPVRVARIRHTRFTLPISNMVLLLLGIPFFMNRLPGNVLGQGSKALAICAVAFLTTFLGQQVVGTTGGFWQALPYWLPIFVFGPIAVLLMDNVDT
ncbi:MAG: LptF/LptG family permease [Phycisphaerae bacterium]|nr:LptF/LptG family permease [Phycisphaerae bacterium]